MFQDCDTLLETYNFCFKATNWIDITYIFQFFYSVVNWLLQNIKISSQLYDKVWNVINSISFCLPDRVTDTTKNFGSTFHGEKYDEGIQNDLVMI